MPASRSDQMAPWLAMLGALLLVAVHVAGKAVRDTLFLSNYPVSVLPQMMIAASVASLLAAVGVSRFLSRMAPARAMPPIMLASGALLFGEWLLVRAAPGPGAIAVYLHLAAISLVLFSGFWSTVNERFDPYTAKAVVARAGAFGCLGGILGGLVAMQVAPRVGVETLLPAFAVLHALVAAVVFGLGGAGRRATSQAEAVDAAQGLRALFSSRFLVQISLLVVLVQVAEQLLDYVFKATAAAAYADEASLVRFFAVFYTATSALAFVLQSSLGPRVLKTLGVGGTLALLPAAVTLASTGAAFFQRILTVAIARGVNNVMSTSFFKAGFELLWTPVPAETKRPAKVYVDVGASGVGDLAGSGLLLLLVAGFAGLPLSILLGLAAAFSMGALFLVAQLQRSYTRQLADNLRSGAVTLDSGEVRDATTARTLAESRLTVDRAELMARVRELDAGGQAPTRSVETVDPDSLAAPAVSAAALVAFASDLASGDPERVRRALTDGRGTLELASFAIPQLARHGVAEETTAFLRDLAPRIVGQLNDALLDPESEVLIRRRVPHALEGAPGRRALDGLLRGLEDADFEVRLECARAAARMTEGQPALRVKRGRVLTLVERELAASDRRWEHQGRRRHDTREEPAILEPGDLLVIDRSMELVFTLLALAQGCEVMGSTLRALHSSDPVLRGTALEYLQTALPEKLRRPLVARVPGGDTARRSQRQAEELADALMQSSAALPRGGRESS